MITIKASGLKEIMQKLRELPGKVKAYITSGIDDEMLLGSIRQSIDGVGLKTRSSNLKNSFRVSTKEKTFDGDVYRIQLITDVPYALRLNNGSAPTIYYTPNGKLRRTGGNRPYHYLELASLMIAEKISARISSAMDRALGELDFK